MATHDYVIDNSTGANVRADINNVLQAVLTNNSNSSSPSTTVAYMLWVDTTANIVKIRNSSNNAWINLFTTAGGVDVDSASNFAAAVTFTDDVTFDGATAGRDVVFDRSDNALEFADNAKAAFGTGSDLQIYHDGTNSYVKNNTGVLYLQGDNIRFLNDAGNENIIKAFGNGAVELYFDNTKRFETTTTGVKTIGDLSIRNSSNTQHIIYDESDGALEFVDSIKATFGTGNDLQIYHDGNNSYIRENGTGSLYIDSNGNGVVLRGVQGEDSIVCNANGAVELYWDNAKKMETYQYGVDFAQNIQIGLHAYFGDNGEAIFGAGSDLKIYHDGGGSYIANSTGILRLQAKAGENSISLNPDGAVELYFDNVKQIETTTLGLNIRDHHKFMTGTVTQRVWQTGSGVCIRPNVAAAGGNNTQGTFIRASANCSNIDDDDTVKFVVFATGDAQNANNSYAGFSDVNLKQDIVDAGSQWDDIKNLKVRKYRFKNNPTGPLQIGCIAQEVETVSAGLIDTDPEEGFKSLKYSVLYMKAIKCLQEAIAKIETLETKVAALETA